MTLLPFDTLLRAVASRRRSMTAIAAITVIALSVFGASSAKAALSTEDQADIARVERYLNQIKTLHAGFIQTGPDGQVAEGQLYLRRPGRLRFEYAPPSPLLVVADGIWLVLQDKELQQVNRWPVYQTPLGVLLADRIDLRSGDAQVVDVERNAGSLRLRLIDPQKPEEGALTLMFSDDPLVLRQWSVRDAQGGVTTVAITGAEVNIGLDPELFVFNDPASEFPGNR